MHRSVCSVIVLSNNYLNSTQWQTHYKIVVLRMFVKKISVQRGNYAMLFHIIFVNWLFLCQKKIDISVVFLQQYRVPDLNTDYNQKLSWFFTTFQVVRFAFAVPLNHELEVILLWGKQITAALWDLIQIWSMPLL